MAKGNHQKPANGSALDFEAQLWAAAEQAVPAPNCNRRKRWPCASTSGGMFVQSEKFVEEHGGRVGNIAVCHQTLWAGGKLSPAMAVL
jgi:hypothetical protein